MGLTTLGPWLRCAMWFLNWSALGDLGCGRSDSRDSVSQRFRVTPNHINSNWMYCRERLRPRGRVDELRRAIEGPARAAGLRFEAGLVDAMLADVEGEPGRPPAALTRPLRVVGPPRRPGPHPGGLPGGRRRAGRDRAHGRGGLPGLQQEEQALMRGMFLRLTELGETTEDTRRRVPLAELIPEGEGGGEATAVLERLAAPGCWSWATTRPRSPTRR